MGWLRSRLSFANVTAVIALFVALGGASYAATQLPKNSVGARQLKKNSVNSSKVRDGSLEAGDFKAGSLPAGERGPPGQPGPPGISEPTIAASVTNTEPQSIIASTIPSLSFDTEEFDTDHLHTGSDSRLTAPVDGIYQASANVTFASNEAGFRALYISVNDSDLNPPAIEVSKPVASPAPTGISVSGLVALHAGDYVLAKVEQTSGGPLDVEGAEGIRGPRLSLYRVGPLS